jgi:hypothetical protein
MNRKLLIGTSILVIGVLIILVVRGSSHKPVSTDNVGDVATTTSTGTPATEDLKVEAWNVFERYIQAAKIHDLVEIKKLSYQMSATCKDNSKIKECNDLMDNAYNLGSNFTLQSLNHMIYDSKQIILWTDYNKLVNSDPVSTIRGVIYFVREGGSIKFLSFKPFDGIIIFRGTDATSTLLTKLDKATLDTDSDTIPDTTELCADQNTPKDCVQTDPTKRDTDGDLWWDPIEALFYK